jgi:hypothetical protein
MGPGLDFSDGVRDALRAIVATIDREMSHLSRPAESEGNRTTDELRSSWAELVELLALGPALKSVNARSASTWGCVRLRAVATAGRSCHRLLPPRTAVGLRRGWTFWVKQIGNFPNSIGCRSDLYSVPMTTSRNISGYCQRPWRTHLGSSGQIHPWALVSVGRP